jgi:hypothetical protein
VKTVRVNVRGFIYFLLAVAAVILTLILLNWLPLALQKDTMRRYASVDEARAKLNLKGVSVPSYFPQNITWPPSEILAQNKPYPAILMVFHYAGKQEAALVISQSSAESFPGDAFITFDKITEAVPFHFKSRQALLEVGTCNKGGPCSRISWSEGGYHIVLAMKSPPFELIRIAESMLH